VLQEAGGYACSLDQDEFNQGEVWNRSVIASLDAELFQSWKAWLRQNQ
jgi:myo-inositol-1(or 4)-monophosphatase